VNTNDRIITALTPGSIFNGSGLVWRSLNSLAQFAGLEENELIDLLNGDLAGVVTCKPSTKGKGILVALVEHLTPPGANQPTTVAALPTEAMGPGDPPSLTPYPTEPENPEEEVEFEAMVAEG